MKENLYEIAKEYVNTIEKIEKTKDPYQLQHLEEKRVELHWKFIESLKEQGILYKDREHATGIAIKIAKTPQGKNTWRQSRKRWLRLKILYLFYKSTIKKVDYWVF